MTRIVSDSFYSTADAPFIAAYSCSDRAAVFPLPVPFLMPLDREVLLLGAGTVITPLSPGSATVADAPIRCWNTVPLLVSLFASPESEVDVALLAASAIRLLLPTPVAILLELRDEERFLLSTVVLTLSTITSLPLF